MPQNWSVPALAGAGLLRFSPASWLEVRLQEERGLEGKVDLERMVRGRTVECIARSSPMTRVVAACLIKGRSLGVMMQGIVPEGGRG